MRYVEQDWYHTHKPTVMPKFHPYVPGALPTVWYKMEEKKHTSQNTWTIWFIYYMHINQLYTVYSNLCAYTGIKQCSLVVNRFEMGLHFRRKLPADVSRLLRVWRNDYGVFPEEPVRLNWNGTYIPSSRRY